MTNILLFYHFCHVLKNKQLNKLDFLLRHTNIKFFSFFPSLEELRVSPLRTVSEKKSENLFSCLFTIHLKITTNDDVELQIFFSMEASSMKKIFALSSLDLIIKYIKKHVNFLPLQSFLN